MRTGDSYMVTDADIELTRSLCAFIQESPSPFHAVDSMRGQLEAHGFVQLLESEPWDIQHGKGYFAIRNGSSIIAFRVGRSQDAPRFSIAASHCDSPTFKVKAIPELSGPVPYTRLNVEEYGGAIERTWLDRPLSLAGRVFVEECGSVRSLLLAPCEDLVLVPSVAIHQDRNVNNDGALNRQVDLCPLFGARGPNAGTFNDWLAARLDVEPTRIISHDLYLANRQAPSIWGASREFFSAPRIDDLQCAYASLRAFLEAQNDAVTTVFACFDNEEVGSGTMQGALSTLLPDVMRRVCDSFDADADADLFAQALARSFVVSCDNAHAVHPNHPELYDEQNRAWINHGVVIKESAAQRYTTNAPSRALFTMLCRRAGVPTQSFANRSDAPGGSTLGNLLSRHVSARSVDVGLPQLAMHSSYETAGTCDTAYMISALQEFYEANYSFGADGSIELC